MQPEEQTRPRLIIFDFDGTIADSKGVITGTARKAFAATGLPGPNETALIEAIGLPLSEALELAAQRPLSESELTLLVDAYRKAWPTDSASQIKVFAGMRELIADLRDEGFLLAIATSKSRAGVKRVGSQVFAPGTFDCLVGDDDVASGKPAPDMVHAILDALRVAPEQALLVGDTEFDMRMGSAAGVRTCGVTWGSHSSERLTAGGANHIVDSVSQIWELATSELR